MGSTEQPSWEQKAAAKRKSCADSIPASWKIPDQVLAGLKQPLDQSRNDLFALDIIRKSQVLTARELEITETYEVASLLGHLAEGSLTAVDVTTAFSKRAAVAQQLTNCLTETFFDQALERAKELDRMREGGRLAGPLHGLPISIKDSFQFKGTQATIGLAAYLDKVSQTNSCLVDILLDLGAVIYVKTNVPQTLMTADSHNNVFGRTLNPRNTSLTAGGSSGGEGALIALRGSLLGAGTDIGGSIRVPAACCGTYGFKPSASRVPYGRQVGCSDINLRQILAVAGPLASDFKALEIFVKAVVAAQPDRYDSTAIGFPWRSVTVKPRLRLGVIAEDPIFPFHPPVKQALAKAAAVLQEQGHEIVQLRPEECRVADAYDVAYRLFTLDTTAQRIVAEGGEQPVPSVVNVMGSFFNLPMTCVPDISSHSEWQKLSVLNGKRAEIAEGWRRIWVDHQLDAVISPVAQHTAIKHDNWAFFAYSCLLNLLDYPGCAIPFGFDAGNSNAMGDEAPGIPTPYEPEVLKGAPLSIQVFTGKLKDEECIAVSEVVDACLQASLSQSKL